MTVFPEEMDAEDAQRLEADPDRYLLIEPVPSWMGYNIMADFVATLPESKVRWELDKALQQNRPVRSFKDVLLKYPLEQEAWFRFHEQAFIKIILEWLVDHGVHVILVPLLPQP